MGEWGTPQRAVQISRDRRQEEIQLLLDSFRVDCSSDVTAGEDEDHSNGSPPPERMDGHLPML
jgi:hypothetical protein